METELPDLLTETQHDLPEGWKRYQLKEVCEKIFDGTHFSPKSKSGPYRYITSKNIRNEGLDISDCLYISEKEHRAIFKRCSVKVGDVLLTKDGAGTGNCCSNTLEEEFSLLSSVAVLRGSQSKLNNLYLLQLLQSPQGQVEIKSVIAGQAITRITLEKINNFTFVLPPLAEQQRIAAILTKWDEGIEKLQAIITKTKQRKAGLMQQLLTGTKRFAEFDGQSWETVRFGNVFSFVRNESHSRDCLTYEETESEVYYVHYGDIHATFDTSVLDFGKETRIPQLKDEVVLSKQSTFLRDGDLLIADASEDYEGIGECVEVKNLGDKVAVGGLHTIIARDSHNLTVPGFRNYLLMHPEVAIAIRKVANGISVYGLSKTALSNIILYLPPLAEQRRIAAVLSAADLEIEGLTQELSLMRNQKRGLMQGLLTGTISVKNMKPKSA